MATADQRRRAREIDWSAVPLGEVADRDLATSLGVSRATVTRARLRQGIRLQHLEEIDPSLLGEGTDREVAEAVGVSEHRIRRARRAAGIPAKGQARPMSLRDRAVRDLSRSGWSRADLAELFGCSVERIRQILLAAMEAG